MTLSAEQLILDSETRAVLSWVSQTQPCQDASISVLREYTKRYLDRFQLPNLQVGSVAEYSVPVKNSMLMLRRYQPLVEDKINRHLPAIFFIHGGGWVQCSIDTHDRFCRHLCHATGCVVISVDYRLAPENPFPGQIEDCRMAYEYIIANSDQLAIDSSCIFICGDSSGGNIATVLCHDLIGSDTPQFIAQLLIYPSVALCKHQSYQSWKIFGDGQYLLSNVTLARTKKYYLRKSEDIYNPRVSPILFSELEGMPPALIIAAEFDPIRDGAREYAGRLIKAGVSVQYLELRKTVHGFISLGTPLKTALRAISSINTYICSIQGFRLESTQNRAKP